MCSSGLSLLASVTSKVPLLSPTSHPSSHIATLPTTGLHTKGPHNPVDVLPTKIAKKILDLEFVEMADISLDDLPQPFPARPPIQMCVEKFSITAALLSSRFLEKVPELFAYQASIVQAEMNFDDQRWVAYVQCYRCEALALKSLDWSIPNARLYNEAFKGHARAILRCLYCLQEDHLTQTCPRNPSSPWFR